MSAKPAGSEAADPAPERGTNHRVDTLTRQARDAGLACHTWAALGCPARLVSTDPTRLADARTAVDRVVSSVDEAASRFREDSELNRVHRDGAGEISPMLAYLVRVALDAAAWTGGLLDPTVGGVMSHLGYDTTFRLVAPEGPAITLVPQAVPGWRRVSLNGSALTLPRGVRLDLGATAKSVAADLAARDAAEAAGCGVLVSLGGDIAVAGSAPAGGWPVLIGDVSERELRGGMAGPGPGDPSEDTPGIEQTVAVTAGGIATSGIRSRRWRRGGSPLHHIIDPRVGLPTQGPWRTVSVTAGTCVLAGTAATTAIIRGGDAPGWLAGLGLAARLVEHDGSVTTTPGWPFEPTGARS